MTKIFKRRIVKTVSVFLLVNMTVQLLAPLSAYALTSGPSTPEVQTFTPAGTTDMVDIFTGKFGYNLPVFELPGPNGGYPFNLSYNGGISMDQEASWVGLGWNLGPGAINREVRGLPDDFNGDLVKYRHDMLPNSTVGINVAFDYEFMGGDLDKNKGFDNGHAGTRGDFTIGLNLYYNTNRGFGLSLEPGVDFQSQSAGGPCGGYGLKLKMDSQEGVGLDPSFSLSTHHHENDEKHTSVNIGIGYNSKRGLTDLSYGFSSTKTQIEGKLAGGTKYKIGGLKGNGSISFAHTAYAPSIDMEMKGSNFSFMLKLGGELTVGHYLNGEMGGYSTDQSVKNANIDVPKKGYGYLFAEQMDPDTKNDVFDFNREKDGLVRDETPNLAIPSMTHDVYNISGQGISGSFRPYRPYVSTLFDPHSASLIGGGSFGIQLGFGDLFNLGIDVTGNVSRTTANEATASSITGGYSKNDFLRNSNPNSNPYNSGGSGSGLPKDYETYYFKCSGEPTTEKKSDYAYMNYDQLTDLSGSASSFPTSYPRKARNSSVQEYKNIELVSNNYLQEFSNVGYYDFSQSPDFSQTITSPTNSNVHQPLSNYSSSTYTTVTNPGWRNALPQNHIGGYTVLQPDGSRYVYGLPVYNTKQVDKHYSVSSIDLNGNAWDPSINGSESTSAKSMLPHSYDDNIFHYAIPSFANDNHPNPPLPYNDNSQCYLNRMELPPYTTSHMITAVLGADYVDVDNNGPSDNDFGYWVKFTYVKVPQYNWKVPYIGANYSKGLNYPGKDDKASYQYGEKDVYYLATAETKTHIAIFDMSERKDASGIPGEFSDQSDPNNPPAGKSTALSYKLNRIRLYSKMEYYDQSGNVNTNATPISTANFEYSYELCQGIPNFIQDVNTRIHPEHEGVLTTNIIGEGISATPYAAGTERPGTGKLTLKKVWFTYERSNRGALTPYQFHYSSNNPNYEHKNQDRWGTYKQVSGTQEYDYPYTPQDSATASNDAQAWSLTDILTPSGSHIKVSYESSDYGYVQNKTAGQMFKIARTFQDDSYPASSPGPLDSRFAHLYPTWQVGYPRSLDAGENRKVYFDLQGESYNAATYSENQSGNPTTNAQILNKYVADLQTPEGNHELYYKVLIDMRSENEPIQEYVSGYAIFDPKNVGFDDKCINNNSSDPNYGKITRGYIYLDMPKLGKTVRDFVPFSVSAWQFFRSAMQEYASDPGKLATPAGKAMSVRDKALEIASAVTGIRDLFTSFYGRASRHGWARRIDLNHSWIRLSTPYKKKYGGGHRVSKITIQSDWDQTYEHLSPATYGVTYDYHDYSKPVIDASTGSPKLDVHGNPMYESSGVAQYEPSVGGDEISLRYARPYPESIPLKTANNVYFEYPVNESYFPGPTVGYRMVTVKSLATDNQLKNLPAMAGVAGTGITVHEFYTAQDFPVITQMTNITFVDEASLGVFRHLAIPIPFIGSIKVDEMKAHQGYMIDVNDMHGKPKKVSYFGQDANGQISGYPSNPLSYVQYTYQTGQSTAQNSNFAKTLSSSVGVMTGEGTKVNVTNTNADNEMGVEYDCFTDMRHSAVRSGSVGVDVNLEIDLSLPVELVAFAIPWPSMSYSQTEVNLGVTNKIIRRTGILTKTEAYDGNSKVVTNNLYYDAQTGRPVLTTVTNDFDAPIYKYNIPAYWVYDGMGGAYKNFGLKIPSGNLSWYSTPSFNSNGEGIGILQLSGNIDNSVFVEGDEFTIAGGKGTVLRKISTNQIECAFYENTGTASLRSGGIGDLRIIRSGRRNLLTTDAGSVTALQDPTIRVSGPSCTPSSSFTYEDANNVTAVKTYTTIPCSSNTTYNTLSKVLSATSVKFEDTWPQDFSQYRGIHADGTSVDLSSILNPYANGAVGVWRPYQTYTYVDDRKQGQSTDLSNDNLNNGVTLVDLKQDGTFDNMPMFDWQNPNFPQCFPKWRLTNTVTAYSPYGYESENMDILKTFSSALYGYDGKLPIAVASNSSYGESAFEGFEEYLGNSNNVTMPERTTGNFTFVNDITNFNMTNYVKIPVAFGYGNDAMINIEPSTFATQYLNGGTTLPANIMIQAEAGGDNLPYENIVCIAPSTTGRGGTLTMGSGNEHATMLTFYDPNSANVPNFQHGQRCWKGNIFLPNASSASGVNSGISFVNTRAHTGKISMQVTAQTQIPQLDLQLQPGKQYVIGAWVSAGTYTNMPIDGQGGLQALMNSSNWSIGVGYGTASTPPTSWYNLSTIKSTMIDGWVRIEDENYITPLSLPAGSVLWIRVQPLYVSSSNTGAVYIDDIRIHPFDGNMKSYVYDPQDYKLKAELDNNNYATFYSYDAAGNLFQIKRETQEGILTVQESRSHIKEN